MMITTEGGGEGGQGKTIHPIKIISAEGKKKKEEVMDHAALHADEELPKAKCAMIADMRYGITIHTVLASHPHCIAMDAPTSHSVRPL